jgi:PPOX class probable FMN-dependent enzyme
MAVSDVLREITSEAELREVLGVPAARVLTKERTALHERDREWLAASPFCLVATAGADGSCDVSPKGDPPGFTCVLDDTTIAIPDRYGNRRADGFRNILANPHVGLLYLVPGRKETLRINGRARLIRRPRSSST